MTIRFIPKGAPERFCKRLSASTFAACSQGAVAVEFALVFPVFLLLIVGVFDIGHMAYGKAVLDGAVQEAARSSSLETSDTAEADEKVRNIIRKILPSSTFTSTRTSYYDFDDIGRPELWNDANANGACDDDESFTDENQNGQWDQDLGNSGNGGANDVVLYKVTVTYKPVFAIPLLAKSDDRRKISASAVKKNQPFANQEEYGSDVGVCE